MLDQTAINWLWSLTVIAYVCVIVDLFMLYFFLQVTIKFVKLLFFDNSDTKLMRKINVSLLLSMMSFCIFFTATKKLYSHTYDLLINLDIIEKINCHDVSLHSHNWFVVWEIILFYFKYSTCFIIGYFILGIFYLFTSPYREAIDGSEIEFTGGTDI